MQNPRVQVKNEELVAARVNIRLYIVIKGLRLGIRITTIYTSSKYGQII